jgi:hypothetical protein
MTQKEMTGKIKNAMVMPKWYSNRALAIATSTTEAMTLRKDAQTCCSWNTNTASIHRTSPLKINCAKFRETS